MKKVFITLLVLVVLLAASPWFVGLRARTVVEDFTEKMGAVPGYTARLASYDAGYLDSDAVVNIGIDLNLFMGNLPPQQRAEMQELIDLFAEGVALHLDIRHGPLLMADERAVGLFTADLALEESSEALRSLRETLGVDAVMTTRAVFGFDGSGDVVVSAPAFTWTPPEGGAFNFGGFDYRVRLQDWGRRFEGSGELHAITLAGVEESFRMAPMVVSASGTIPEELLFWNGEMTLESEGMFITGAEDFALEGLSIAMTSGSPTAETLEISYRLNVRRVSGGGSPQALENLVVHGSVANMRKEALREFYAVIQDPARSGDTQTLLKAIGAMYGDAVFRIDEVSFRYGPDVDLHLTGNYSFSEDFFTSMANAALAQPDPAQMIGMLSVQMSLDFSQGVIDSIVEIVLANQVRQMAPDATPEQVAQLIELQKVQLATMIPGLVQSGMLREAGRGYQADLQLEGGTLTINGNVIPIPGM